MKPLSIEELKQLKEYDYFWLVNINDANKNIYISNISYTKETLSGLDFYNYSRRMKWDNYGKTWLAYKNKEQAECKGEFVELICKLDDTIYVPCKYDGVSSIAELQVVYIEVNKWHNNYVTNLGDTIDMDNFKEFRYYQRMHHGVYSEQNFNKVWFKDKKLAEQKLIEL